MNKHTVFVAGKRFVLLSDDKEAYVKKLADNVSATITKIISENPTLDRRSAALLCALDYADDMEKEKLRNKSLSDKAQPFITQADKQAKQIRELTAILEKKDEEIRTLIEENVKLKNELENRPQISGGEETENETPAGEISAEAEPSDEQKEASAVESQDMSVQPKPEKPMGRKKKKKNKGYKPMRQFSLFEDEKN